MKTTAATLALSSLVLIASASLSSAQTAAPQPPAMSSDAPMGQKGMHRGDAAGMGGDRDRMMEMMPDKMRRMMVEHRMNGERAGMGMPFEHIEGRIAYLKAELKITEAQTAPWNAYAESLRSNADAMKTMHASMTKEPMATNLPDRLAAEKKMATSHLAAVDKMEAASKPLYAALSEEQRKMIDQMTADHMRMM